jgi:hypothetical protein
VPIGQHLHFVDQQGRRTIADWVERGRELVAPERIRDELLKILDDVQKDAARGYVGEDVVYRAPPPPAPWWRKLLKAVFPPDAPARLVWTVVGGICVAVALAMLGLRR